MEPNNKNVKITETPVEKEVDSFLVTANGLVPNRINYKVEDEKKMLDDVDSVILEAGDGGRYIVVQDSIVRSSTIKDLVTEVGTKTIIPLPNISTKTLGTVVDFLMRYKDQPIEVPKDDDVKDESVNHASAKKKPQMDDWDEEFVTVSNDLIFEMINAANYLAITKMLEMCCSKVADKIKGKSPEEIRTEFNIKNDFTPEEEEEIKRESEWVAQ